MLGRHRHAGAAQFLPKLRLEAVRRQIGRRHPAPRGAAAWWPRRRTRRGSRCAPGSASPPGEQRQGGEVLVHVAAEIGRIVGVDRRHQAGVAASGAAVLRRGRARRTASGSTAGRRSAASARAASRVVSAGSSSARSPWSMRSTFSRSSASQMYAGGPSSPACATGAGRARGRGANTRSNFAADGPCSDESRPTPMKWSRHGSASSSVRSALVLVEVAQEAQDQRRRRCRTARSASRQRARQAVDHGLEGDAALGVGLRVEEDLGVAHVLRAPRLRGRPSPCRRSPARAAARSCPRSRCRGSPAGR